MIEFCSNLAKITYPQISKIFGKKGLFENNLSHSRWDPNFVTWINWPADLNK
jgi:hypothetical protein